MQTPRGPNFFDIANNTRNDANSKKHEYCKDNSTVDRLAEIKASQQPYIDALKSYFIPNSNILDDVTKVYKSVNNDYKNRINIVKQYYIDLGDEIQTRGDVDNIWNPQITVVKQEKAIYDASNAETISVLKNYNATILPGAMATNDLAATTATEAGDLLNVFGKANAKSKTNYYSTITLQNDMLKNQMQDMRNSSLTNFKQSNYKNASVLWFSGIKYWLFIIYYILLFIILILAFYKKTRFDFIIQLVILGLFVVFPFIISLIEIYIYNSWKFLHSIMTGTPYVKFDYYNSIRNGDVTNINQNINPEDLRKPRPIISDYLKKNVADTVLYVANASANAFG
jgi:hypothetical protein